MYSSRLICSTYNSSRVSIELRVTPYYSLNTTYSTNYMALYLDKTCGYCGTFKTFNATIPQYLYWMKHIKRRFHFFQSASLIGLDDYVVHNGNCLNVIREISHCLFNFDYCDTVSGCKESKV